MVHLWWYKLQDFLLSNGWVILHCVYLTPSFSIYLLIKRCLLLGGKVITNLDSILKNRDITLATKAHLVKAMVFQVVMCGCESWTMMKTERWRINAFKLWCWRRLLRVPWTARRSNQSILKDVIPEYSLEGLMMKLKLQYFGHLMQRTDTLEKTLMLRKTEGRGCNGWMASPRQWTWVWVSSRSWWWTGKTDVLQSMGLQKVRHDSATELNWTEEGEKMHYLWRHWDKNYSQLLFRSNEYKKTMGENL